MSSQEFTGPVHLARNPRGLRAGAVAKLSDGMLSLPAACLGLCWGLCVPLLVTVRPRELIGAWAVSLPVCLMAFLLAQRTIAAWLRRSGLSARRAASRAAFVLAPSWIVGFAPLVLFVPARSLPVVLVFVAVALTGYRIFDVLHSRARARTPLRLETILFVVSFMAGTFVLFQVHVVHDAFQYYGYLASVVLDGDLQLYDQIYIHNAERFYNPFPQQSARYMGTAMMEAPFFAAGHAVATAFRALGHPVPANGYGLPYGFCVTLASALFGLGGMALSYRWARDLFPRRTALIAVLGVAFASPLVFFMYSWGGWAHPTALFLVAAFLVYWHGTRPDRTTLQWAMLGLLTGLIALVRPTAVLVLVFPLLEWVATLVRRGQGGRGRSLVTGPAVAALAALAAFSPQLSLWKALSGSWFSAPYREVGDFHDWLRPDFAGLLLSVPQHGLFAWTPLLLIAGLGIAALFRVDRLIALGSALTVLGTIYVYACWSIWWTGIGYSNRFFIELTPLFALGLAALLARLKRRPAREWAVGVVALAVAWNLFLVGAYRANDIPQGIPDPHRVVDAPLDLSRLAATGLQLTEGDVAPRWLEWGADGFYTDRLIRAAAFHDPGALVPVVVLSSIVALLATLLVRSLLRRRREGGRTRGPALTLAAGLIAVAALHGVIWNAAARTTPFGRFHRLPATGTVIRQPAADTWIHSDYPQPVISVDLLTHLIYGHGVPQGAVVASVTIFDTSGRAFEHLLRAGIETAEASFPRPEYRDAIRHGIDLTDPVRATPAGVYSARDWESLTFRSVVDLPEPVAVQKIRLRYLHPLGRLVVSDVFLREFE